MGKGLVAKKPAAKATILSRPAAAQAITKRKPKPFTFRTKQVECLETFLKDEIHEWSHAVASSKYKRGEFRCPLCARFFNVRRRAVTHAAMHIHGRSASLYREQQSSEEPNTQSYWL